MKKKTTKNQSSKVKGKKVTVRATKTKKNIKSSKKTKKVLVKKNRLKKSLKKRILPKKKSNKSLKKPRIKKILIKKNNKKPSAHKKSRAKSIKKSDINLMANNFFKPKIKVIGIGGGGGSIVSEIGRSLEKAKFVIADTDSRSFKKRSGIKYFLFGQKITHGLGSGLDPNLGRTAAEEEKEKIAKLFEGEDLLIFVASLGGGIGSGATPVFTEISKNFEGISFGIFTLPFKFEGKNKYKLAVKSLGELRKNLNVSITIENEKIFKIIDEDTSITNAFSMVNKSLIESLESLIDLIYNPGIINIDFADLRTILNGRGNLAFLNTAEASGKEKIEKISKEILQNPLLQNPLNIKGKNGSFVAEKIMFNIEGGKSLSMIEVDKISRVISEQNPKAKIIFGISKVSKYKDKIKVTILMTGASPIKDNIEAEKLTKILPAEKVIKKVIPSASLKKIKSKKNKKTKKKKKNQKNKPSITISGNEKEDISLIEKLAPVFSNIPVNVENSVKSSIAHESKNLKKAIRRSALEIKNAQDVEEKKKTQQEKEWEIPAFLRLKKVLKK